MINSYLLGNTNMACLILGLIAAADKLQFVINIQDAISKQENKVVFPSFRKVKQVIKCYF